MQWKFRIAVAVILVVLVAGIVRYCLAPDAQDPEFTRASEEFAAQINELGKVLGSGEQSSVTIAVRGTHELFLLAPYCPRERIEACVGPRKKLVDSFANLALSDTACPALIWVRDGNVISIKKARLETAIQFHIHCWTVTDHLEVLVEKEQSSANDFLSLRFVDGTPP